MAEPESSTVWFYLLSQPGEQARLTAACRIADKAWQSGRRVLACAADSGLAAEFDTLLWTFRQDSFVPHARAEDAGVEDTIVVDRLDGPAAGAAARGEAPLDVLLVLDATTPEWGLGAKRVAAVVGGDDAGRAAGRAAFKRWQALGMRPHTVEM